MRILPLPLILLGLFASQMALAADPPASEPAPAGGTSTTTTSTPTTTTSTPTTTTSAPTTTTTTATTSTATTTTAPPTATGETPTTGATTETTTTTATTTTTETPAGSPTAGTLPAGLQVTKTSDFDYLVPRELIEYYASNPKLAFELAKTAWAKNKKGEVWGVRMRRVKPGNVLYQAGFRSGDVIRTVNGKPVASVTQALGALKQLKKKDKVEVVLKRKGAGPVTLRFEIS